MSIAWPRTTSTTFGKQLQTKHCLSSAIHYVNTKREIEGKSTDDTTAANVIERLIEIVNKRGFINLTEPLLEAHISLLEVVKKEKKKRTQEKKHYLKRHKKLQTKWNKTIQIMNMRIYHVFSFLIVLQNGQKIYHMIR
jgi:hypothetical protein